MAWRDARGEQERAFLETCHDWQFPVFLTLMLTGLRPVDLVGSQPVALDQLFGQRPGVRAFHLQGRQLGLLGNVEQWEGTQYFLQCAGVVVIAITLGSERMGNYPPIIARLCRRLSKAA